jgi:hypothetical protein
MERREHDIQIAHERVATLGRGLAAKQEGITASTRQVLKAISQVPELQNMDRRYCEKIFANLNKRNRVL